VISMAPMARLCGASQQWATSPVYPKMNKYSEYDDATMCFMSDQ
jgi:hypothetical protein